MKKTAITLSLLRKLLILEEGKSLPGSQLKGDWVEQLLGEATLVCDVQKSRKRYFVANLAAFRQFVTSFFGIENIENAINALSDEHLTRAEAVKATGGSKPKSIRSMTGFLVNSYQPIQATLNKMPIVIAPPKGSFYFIADYENFEIPSYITIVGVENAENFRYIRQQQYLFSGITPLFVSRYPQNGDLIKWLQRIPNSYLHFGDLDLAGINIFQTEFKPYLKERASFFIPNDSALRLSKGNRERYDIQLEKFGKIKSTDKNIQKLIDLINLYHRGYDQEGFIESER
ncbi:hypothetical protein [Prevotella disiens]|uniref:Wadjet protein JetD C-terminal domain-containing protein n=4 Tax=Prevotella disiens TaxID=28130 RepID=A0A379E0R4_9BACT|nr:hypothetical protein [Prevotella disiens]EFL47244.1 hypothetical protein HMPREF9296_0064 [Prevotella disiens FB035-09AN]ERJ77076.1 hypothetical protein HMPREF0653_01230 [Prevotella disiens JCM 6334 = ATCC 29426]RGK96451.1 hypothetical protein DXC89_08825 [Prevotella disiens]SUB86308.1 Uncharacterised protein [Prevotella disiens]